MSFVRSVLLTILALGSFVGDFWIVKESGFPFVYRMSLDVAWNVLILGTMAVAYWLLGGKFKTGVEPKPPHRKSPFDI
jgi:hypothetical protein